MNLSKLEKDILQWFADANPNSSLSKQVGSCTVMEREETGAGFITTFEVSSGTSRVCLHDGTKDFFLNELKMVSPDLKDGADVLLHFRNGLIDNLEVFAITEGDPFHVSDYTLEKQEVNYIIDLNEDDDL